MSDQSGIIKPKSRLVFIDLLRGLVLLVMIEVHIFNAFLIPDLKLSNWYYILNFINGLVAPSFIFISGFVFLLASQKKIESFRTYGSLFWKQIGRISLIWIMGYLLHLPFFSFHRSISESTESQLLSFYQSDVLHCIAFGLFVLFLLRLFIRSDQVYKRTLFLSGMAIVAATSMVWDIDFTKWIPAPIASYINSQHYSLFPLFPWLAFMLFGGYFASGYITARENQKEKSYIIRFALIGGILAVICSMGKHLPLDFILISNDIRANPFFFFQRLGTVMVLLTLCWSFAEYQKLEKSFILNVSKESLMVYSAHLLVIYGKFWNDRSLVYIYGGTFGVLECIASTLMLMILMIAIAMIWGWLKHKHQPLAKVMFWIFSATLTIWFFTH